MRSELKITLGACLTALALIGAAEGAYRHAGGLPLSPPGRTRVEFQQRVAGISAENAVVLVGDSRASWGFSEAALTSGLGSCGQPELRAVNVGLPATGVAPILGYLQSAMGRRPPRLLVVSYSPAGFYHFGADLIDASTPMFTLQEAADDRIDLWLTARWWTFRQPFARVLSRIGFKTGPATGRQIDPVARTVYPDGLVTFTLAANDDLPFSAAEHQLNYYKTVVPQLIANRAHTEKRRAEVVRLLRELRSQGWPIELVRLPISPEMRAVEAEIPTAWGGAAIAAEVDIPFRDYNLTSATAQLATADHSHLTPDSARAFSRTLAADLCSDLSGKAGSAGEPPHRP